MYDAPSCRRAWAALWASLRDHLREAGFDAPDDLCWPEDLMAHWRAPDLLLAHTCGKPFRDGLHNVAQVVGTIDFGLPGCPPGYYTSEIVVAADDPRRDLTAFAGAPWACNDTGSQSGHAAMLAAAEAAGVHLGAPVHTGSHRASIAAVAEDKAALAAIDGQTWRIAVREDAASGLRVLMRTPPTPGTPLITAHTNDVAKVRQAVEQAFTDVPGDVLLALDIRGFVPCSSARYL